MPLPEAIDPSALTLCSVLHQGGVIRRKHTPFAVAVIQSPDGRLALGGEAGQAGRWFATSEALPIMDAATDEQRREAAAQCVGALLEERAIEPRFVASVSGLILRNDARSSLVRSGRVDGKTRILLPFGVRLTARPQIKGMSWYTHDAALEQIKLAPPERTGHMIVLGRLARLHREDHLQTD